MRSGAQSFPYTLRATGHENTLAFELIAKNGKWIAVCHGPSKRDDDSKGVYSLATGMPRAGLWRLASHG
jgi:hypothetical protein